MENERELHYVRRTNTAVPGLISEKDKPFSEASFLDMLLARVVSMFLEALEMLLGKKLFIKDFGDELDYVEPKILRFISRLIDEKIIRSLNFKYPIPDWPKIICAHLSLEPVKIPNGIARVPSGSVGDGAAFDHNTAATKALAECLERYSMCNYDPNDLIKGSFSELKSKGVLDPNLFKAFSDEQLKDPVYHKNHYFNCSTMFSWTRVVSLVGEKQFLVPAQLVFLLYETREGEPIIRGMTTSGAAAGSSRGMAAYNAICEAIERDSFMIFWLNKLTPPVIDLSDIDNPVILKILEECRRHNINITFFDITTDVGVSTVLAVILDNAVGRCAVRVAPRTDLDIEQAIIDASIEALKAGVSDDVTASEREAVHRAGHDIYTLPQRRIFWSDQARKKEIDFLFGGPLKKIIKGDFFDADYDKKLKGLKKILQENDFEAYLADVTAPIAKEAGLTIFVSLLPRLYPLYLNEHYKYLGVKRLYDAPVKMGCLKTPRKEEEMNLVPHPML